jgi:hypothetical protein
MKRKIVLLTAVSIIVVAYFLFDKKEERENLGSSYYYIPFQEITFDVTGFGGNGIYIFKDSSQIPVIFPRVVSYKYDSRYIVVKQKYDYTEIKELLGSMLFLSSNYFTYDKNFVPIEEGTIDRIKTISHSTFKQRDSIINEIMTRNVNIIEMKANKYSYYIIDKSNNTIVGPLAYDVFLRQKKKMGITLSLK